MPNLRKRLGLKIQTRKWLAWASKHYHYMHKEVHVRASPFGWSVTFDGKEKRDDGDFWGFIVFATIHFTRMKGEFGYEGLPTKWQVLNLSRLWLHDDLPHNSETCVIAKALKLVQHRWLEVHPPRFPNEPYHILKVISYADGEYHNGTIYRAANFRELNPVIVPKKTENRARGTGIKSGNLLYRFVYDLPYPNWKYQPLQPTLSIGENRES